MRWHRQNCGVLTDKVLFVNQCGKFYKAHFCLTINTFAGEYNDDLQCWTVLRQVLIRVLSLEEHECYKSEKPADGSQSCLTQLWHKGFFSLVLSSKYFIQLTNLNLLSNGALYIYSTQRRIILNIFIFAQSLD